MIRVFIIRIGFGMLYYNYSDKVSFLPNSLKSNRRS